MCPVEANTYDIEFTKFKIRDMEKGTVLFEIVKPSPSFVRPIPTKPRIKSNVQNIREEEMVDQSNGRFIRYNFNPQFLKLKTVGAT